jgi:hypothetical protein
MFLLAVALQGFGAVCLGFGVALVLDHFGLLVSQEGAAGELLEAAEMRRGEARRS